MRFNLEILSAFSLNLLRVLGSILLSCLLFLKLHLVWRWIWNILSIPYHIYQHFFPDREVNIPKHYHDHSKPEGRLILELWQLCFLPFNAFAMTAGSPSETENDKKWKKICFTLGWIGAVVVTVAIVIVIRKWFF